MGYRFHIAFKPVRGMRLVPVPTVPLGKKEVESMRACTIVAALVGLILPAMASAAAICSTAGVYDENTVTDQRRGRW